jgi:hypothetical protein
MWTDKQRTDNRARATRWLLEVVFGPSISIPGGVRLDTQEVLGGMDDLSFWLLIHGVEADDPITLALALELPLPPLRVVRQRHARVWA